MNTSDEELEVFSAEKYFSEGMIQSPKVDGKNLSSDRHKTNEVLQFEVFEVHAKTAAARQVVHSPTDQQLRRRNKKSFLTSIFFYCCMSYIEVDDCADESAYSKRMYAANQSMKTMGWDEVSEGGPSEIKIPDDESGSYTSSDLFEIENLSRSNPFLSRQASGGLSSSITTETYYVPSNVSMEWSVLIPTAADFARTSNSEEFGFTSTGSTIPRPQEASLNTKLDIGVNHQF